MQTLRATSALLLVAALTACGGATTRQERAGESAEKRADAAERDVDAAERKVDEADRKVDQAEETEDVIKSNSPEAVQDANDILEATPEPAPKRER